MYERQYGMRIHAKDFGYTSLRDVLAANPSLTLDTVGSRLSVAPANSITGGGDRRGRGGDRGSERGVERSRERGEGRERDARDTDRERRRRRDEDDRRDGRDGERRDARRDGRDEYRDRRDDRSRERDRR